MIERLLKEALPLHYGISQENVTIPTAVHDNPFTETDKKACSEMAGAKNNGKSVCQNCDHTMLRVDNNGQSITVVRFEEYVNSLPAKITDGKKRCDLLMTDGMPHNKIVFCDLCCYEEKYISNKRAKAHLQMEQSVDFLLTIDVLNHYILTYPQKVCLFAYRLNAVQHPVKAERGNAESVMQTMMTTPSSVSAHITTKETIMRHSFTFVQTKYPDIYKW